MVLLNRVARSADLFDIIHFHIDYLHFPLFAPRWSKTLTTFHGRLDLPDLVPVVQEFSMMPLVSISNAQRTPLPCANWYGTVHHGLPDDLYPRVSGEGGYLAFVGRICPEKGPDARDRNCTPGRSSADHRRQGRQGRSRLLQS